MIDVEKYYSRKEVNWGIGYHIRKSVNKRKIVMGRGCCLLGIIDVLFWRLITVGYSYCEKLLLCDNLVVGELLCALLWIFSASFTTNIIIALVLVFFCVYSALVV